MLLSKATAYPFSAKECACIFAEKAAGTDAGFGGSGLYPVGVVTPTPGLDSLLQQFVASAEKAGIEFSPKCKTLSVDERQPLTYLDEAVGTLSKTRGLHNDGSVYPSSSILYSVTPSSPDGETCSISLMWNSSYNDTADLVQSDTTEAFYLASKLISIMTYNASEDVVANGNTSIHFPPEEINMKRNGIFTRGFTKPVCTHLDTTTNSFTQEGCQTDASVPRNGVSCICNTGTSFALLTDVTIMLTNQRTLVIVLCVGIAVSLLCLIFLFIGSCIFQRLKHLPERHTIRSLAMALIFANIALLCDTIVDWKFIINYPNLVTLVVHFSLLAVCMWLLILIFDFVIKTNIQSCRSNSNTCLYQTFGWGIPILIAGLSAGLLWDYYTDEIFWPWLDPDVVYVLSLIHI
ncbi:adhesion G-protein coupled receptor G6-like [Anneissia japonica]|uniref:adhesion G-protein coupled receptor G6-like n=1 Tax=Anneissia japonica TaxID=1529436 RepID=UPI0014258FF6|nr:adhesion G-protein coupled receptor G6-like [Anneissia japonica]